MRFDTYHVFGSVVEHSLGIFGYYTIVQGEVSSNLSRNPFRTRSHSELPAIGSQFEIESTALKVFSGRDVRTHSSLYLCPSDPNSGSLVDCHPAVPCAHSPIRAPVPCEIGQFIIHNIRAGIRVIVIGSAALGPRIANPPYQIYGGLAGRPSECQDTAKGEHE